MNPGWSPAHERAATLPFDGQGVSAWDARQTAKERRPSDNSMAAFPLLRFLYWIYERRLLNQLKQRPMPRHVGIILDGNRRLRAECGKWTSFRSRANSRKSGW